MNRYNAATGRTERVPEPEETLSPLPPAGPGPNERRPPARPGMLGGLDGLLKRFNFASLETEDLMLIGVFYLLYRESGDVEFLLMAGAMLFL